MDFLLQGEAYQSLIITTASKWYVLCSVSAHQRAALAAKAKSKTIQKNMKKDKDGKWKQSGVKVTLKTCDKRGIQKLLAKLEQFYSVIATMPVL